MIERFHAALVENRVMVHGPVPRADAAATAVDRTLAHSTGGPVALAPADPLVAALELVDWLERAECDVLVPEHPDWRDRLPAADIGVTGAAFAVAETGSLALAAGPGSPRGVSLLPPVHLCLVALDDVVPTFADAITRVARGPFPSALTWIGGPSRTGDLEMIQTLGVHGPRSVEVVLVDG